MHPACRDEHPPLERADEGVVVLDGAVQRAAELGGVAAERRETRVELSAHLEELARVAGQRVLLPGEGHGAQQGEQRAGRGEHDPPRHRRLVQARVGVQRGGEDGVAGDEADHHLGGGGERLPVRAAGEHVDVPSQGLGVLGEQPRALLVVVSAGLQERRQRCLRVDDEVLAAGQVHDEVGPQHRAVSGRGARLLGEVDPREHAGVLDHPPQLRLAPRATGVGRPQRPRQRGRLGAQGLTGRRHRRHLLTQPRVLLDAVALELGDLPLDAGEAVAQRDAARRRSRGRDRWPPRGRPRARAAGRARWWRPRPARRDGRAPPDRPARHRARARTSRLSAVQKSMPPTVPGRTDSAVPPRR